MSFPAPGRLMEKWLRHSWPFHSAGDCAVMYLIPYHKQYFIQHPWQSHEGPCKPLPACLCREEGVYRYKQREIQLSREPGAAFSLMDGGWCCGWCWCWCCARARVVGPLFGG